MDSLAARPHRGRRTKNLLLTVGGILFAVIVAGLVLLHHFWPFTESEVRSNLASAVSAQVSFGSFHETYFPPGCVVENAVFQRKGSQQPLITIRKLVIRAYPTALFHKHVSLIRAEGARVILGKSDFSNTNSDGEQRTIDRLVADDVVLEIAHKVPEQNTRFVFHKFTLKNLGGSGTIDYSAVFDNPEPTGVIRTSGQFGPWKSGAGDQTPVSGKYSLENADLSVFGGIAGRVSSTGDFQGTFKQIDVVASTTSPEFIVAKTHHGLPLSTNFTASVNATTGDVVLHQVNAKYGRNDIVAKGTIARGADGKRSAVLELRCARGKIEDVFYPFIHAPKSPLMGDVAFTMRVTIPSGKEPFLQKLDLQSDFQIQNARFTHEETQAKLNKIAEGPHQKQPTETLADFHGTVTISNGVAHFSSLSVQDQDAKAFFQGSFGLITERVNMHGRLKTATSLTKTTSGISAVFAKVLEPFFKKKPHDTVVPVKIGGTYSHPSFGLNM